MAEMFYRYGKFCASHPCEVIVAFLTLSICIFSAGPKEVPATCAADNPLLCHVKVSQLRCSTLRHPLAGGCCCRPIHSPRCGAFSRLVVACPQETSSGDAVILTVARSLALLYVYYQFRNLYKIGSKYLVGIAGLFTVFSSFIFSSGVINFLNGDFSELKCVSCPCAILCSYPSILNRVVSESVTRRLISRCLLIFLAPRYHYFCYSLTCRRRACLHNSRSARTRG